LFPHAVAGPLYRIEKDLADIGKGDLRKDTEIRKGDELKDLADSINLMIAGLRDRIKTISDISGQIRGLTKEATAERPDETLEKIRIANANLQEAINKFRL
jgi:methyl-accepting chemotaxis protein